MQCNFVSDLFEEINSNQNYDYENIPSIIYGCPYSYGYIKPDIFLY